MIRRLALPLLVLASALLLAACGGSSGSENDEEKITEAITTSATSTDPAKCKEFETQAFMEQIGGVEGAEAVKECEEEAESTNNKEVTVTKVETDGSDASADVAFIGGSYDGQKVNVALVEEGGDWKLDRITRFVSFDKEKLIGGFEEGLESADLSGEQKGCISEQLREASDSDLEELVLNGSEERFVELLGLCVEGT